MKAQRKPFSDPGGETANAPIGSEDWAKRWRLELSSLMDHVREEPERIARYVELGTKHEAWTMCNKRDGTHFKTFDEFCAYEVPWGLGRDPGEVRAILELAKGKRHVQVLTLRPAASNGGKRDGAGRKPKMDNQNGDTNLIRPTVTANTAETKLRRVAREAANGSTVAAEALSAYERGDVSAAGAERMAGLGKPPKTPEQKVATVIKRAPSSERVTAALRALELLSTEERAQVLDACRKRGWAA